MASVVAYLVCTEVKGERSVHTHGIGQYGHWCSVELSEVQRKQNSNRIQTFIWKLDLNDCSIVPYHKFLSLLKSTLQKDKMHLFTPKLAGGTMSVSTGI